MTIGSFVRAQALPLEIAAVAGVLALSAGGGWKAHDWIVYQPHLQRDLKTFVKALEAKSKTEATGVQIATAVRDKHDTQQAQVRTTTQTIIKEVPYYVPSYVDREGSPGGSPPGVSVGFGRVLDYAALGVNPPVPAPSRESLDASGGIGMSAVAGSVAGNYGVCHSWRTEVMAWREWYDREAGSWPVK